MNIFFTENVVSRLVEQNGFKIIEKTLLAERKAKHSPIPSRLYPSIQNYLKTTYPDGLYSHQAEAIDTILKGEDVCLATSTASGKSIVFMSAAIDFLIRNGSANVMALYPARALIQDQIKKWQLTLEYFGLTVGYIDGGVATERRLEILNNNRVILMTPDVAHAWVMSHLQEKIVRNFLSTLKLLILDEAHVYEGVFGTNMAYFLRRFEVASCRYRLVCSTATLGKPENFVHLLTGRNLICFGGDEDGSASPKKTILLANETAGKMFENMTRLLRSFASCESGRFLAFGDSRRMVEQLVAATHRSHETNREDETAEGIPDDAPRHRILPYRAGYEPEDRTEIQKSLERGSLIGVVSTSAMEMGLDIGEIDLVVLLGVPPSMKALWQRIGRAGRQNSGVCLLIDDKGLLSEMSGGLSRYLERPLEPSWLYLENRYIQYVNALCAATELVQLGQNSDTISFQTVPTSFAEFLENELNPTEVVPQDLYPLKQRAQGGPHREFPIRSGIEQSFQVTNPQNLRLGNLTFSQALREAYPGAIYHYMSLPHRVYRFDYRKGEINAKREKHWTTKALAQVMVFPRFKGGILQLYRSEAGFLAETEMQVSERVIGFIEQRGSVKTEYLYGPGSNYSQRELNRFFETTGVCWYFSDRFTITDKMAQRLLEAFSIEFGVQERDLGIGLFHAKYSPLGEEKCQGICVFDSTNGSLRLTQGLAEKFSDVISAAISIAHFQEDQTSVDQLESFLLLVKDLQPHVADTSSAPVSGSDGDWVIVISPGEKAMYMSGAGPREVEISGFRYTPKGLMYDLEHHQDGINWTVVATAIQPVHGETRMIRANLITGETEQVN